MAELPELEPILAPLLARFWRFIPGLVGLGTAGAYSQIYGQQTAQGSSGGVIDSILHAIATAPSKVFGGLTGTSSHIHATTRATVSHWALAADTETAHWFDHLNVLTKATYAANLANVNAAASAIERLSAREHADTHYRDGTAVKERAQTALNTATSTATRFGAFRATYDRTHAAQVRLNVRYSHAIDVAIPKQLGRIETKQRVQSGDIAKVRDAVRGLEDGAVDTFKWLSAHRATAAMGVFAGAVAWALEHLGYGFLRCRSWQNLGRQMKCSDANVLRDLLIGATAIALSTNLVELAKLEQTVMDDLTTVVRDFWQA